MGTASMLPTRLRAHNSYAVRWDDQLILFDPGEGAQRGCTLTGVSIAKATAVCVTHFHGDHCLGLPGVIQRRSVDNNANNTEHVPLPVFYPGDGQEYFDRLRNASIFHDLANVDERPISHEGEQAKLGNLTLTAYPLLHRSTAYGYRLQEPDSLAIDRERLAATGVSGPDVGTLLSQGWVDGPDGRVEAADVTITKRGQSMAFIMDTMPCESILDLARDVDLMVCESTYVHDDVELANKHMHMTARLAAEYATEAGARRLVLTHFSARYQDNAVFSAEASRYHPDVVVADELSTTSFPPVIRDDGRSSKPSS